MLKMYKVTGNIEELIPRWGKSFLHIPELDGQASGNRDVDPLAWGQRIVEARGWPCLAVWGGMRPPFVDASNNIVAPSRWIVRGAIPLDQFTSNYGNMRFLPYLPLWPGFAINTIFYVAVLWLFFLLFFIAPRRLRRRHRIKRGLCLACGYDLRASRDKCPECGAAISLRSAGEYTARSPRDKHAMIPATGCSALTPALSPGERG